jgi:hypothetical protein
MAIATLRVNPENTDFEIDLPDGSEDAGEYIPGEGAVIIGGDNTPYYLTFDEFDASPLKPNHLYKLVEVDLLVSRDAELEEVEETEVDDDEDGEDDHDEAED